MAYSDTIIIVETDEFNLQRVLNHHHNAFSSVVVFADNVIFSTRDNGIR